MPSNQKKKVEKKDTELKKSTIKSTSKPQNLDSKKAAVSNKKKSTSSSNTNKKTVGTKENAKKQTPIKSNTTKSTPKIQNTKKNSKVVAASKGKTSTETSPKSKKASLPKTESKPISRSKTKQVAPIKVEKKPLETKSVEPNEVSIWNKLKTDKKVFSNEKKSVGKRLNPHLHSKNFSILKSGNTSKPKKKKKNNSSSTKSNFISEIREKLKNRNSHFTFKKLKRKENSKKSSSKKTNSSKNNSKLKKQTIIIPKKWVIGIVVLCVTIILAETVYFIYHKIDIEHNTIYYDSLNSVSIDNMDIVLVGSSNFRYSKYYGYTNGLEKAKLIKYNSNGEILFEKMYDKGINTTFSSVISVSDGYVVVGSGEFSEQEQQDGGREALIIKYSKDGNIIWEKYYQVVTNTRFNKVIETVDGYIAIGQSIYANMEMGNHTTGGGIIVKYDKDGNEIWHNNHGGMKSGNFNDVVEVNGNFYVVGKDATDSANLVKFNNYGEYQWHKNYSYTDEIGFTGIAYLDQSLYVVGAKKILPEGTGDEDNRDTTNTDALLVKYDLDGNIIFEKSFGGSNYERYNSILTYRNDLYIVGHTTSTDAGLKINTDGELMTGILVRYDSNGNILKKESLGGSNNDNLTDIVTDGVSLYISAYSNSKDGNITTAKNNGKDYFGKMIKLDFKFRTLLVK